MWVSSPFLICLLYFTIPEIAMNLLDFSHGVFRILNLSSMIFSILVFKIFQVMKQNVLIRSASVIFFAISFLLFLGWPLQTSDVFCNVQALFLNYCYISAHAHFSFIMWNNLSVAMGWKILGIQDPTALAGIMIFVSLSIPIVPTIIILAMSLDPYAIDIKNMIKGSIVSRKAFHCVINEPAWWGYRIWFILFSGPGIVAACILFVKTIESRRKMLKYSNTSQFSKIQIARMFFAIISYMVLSILSVFMGFMDSKGAKNVDLSDFIPACVGFLLFITYGAGNTAFEFYRKIYIDVGSHFGMDVSNIQESSLHSRKNSATTITLERRNSSIKSTEIRLRRQSQISEEKLDEQYIYDLSLESETVPNIYQISRRNQFRRGSEPPKTLNMTIDAIQEVNEDYEDNAGTEEDSIESFTDCSNSGK